MVVDDEDAAHDVNYSSRCEFRHRESPDSSLLDGPIEPRSDEVQHLARFDPKTTPFSERTVISRLDGHCASPSQDDRERDGSGSPNGGLGTSQTAALESGQTWPDAIHDAMQICVALRTPAAILWGDDWRVFHNDACRESCVVTEPSFGRPAREVWLSEWADLEPIVASVRRTRVSMWLDGAERDGGGAALRRSVSLAPLLDATGAVHGVFCNWPQVDASREPATAGGDFVIGAIAHELRNPLGSIANLVEVLRGDSRREEALATIDRLVDYMTDLVQDLFDEVWRGGAELRMAPSRVEDVVRDAVAAAYGSLVASRCAVTVSVAGSDLEIVADRKRLVRALANVVANLARIAPTQCEIEVSASQTPGEVVFGIGEPGLDATRVRSLTLEDAPRFAPGGLGLGFWLARRITLAHGGRFSVETSADGRGTNVRLALPRAGAIHWRAQPLPVRVSATPG
jgi:Histidine kinase-, DNA gyrase B-, and HSP90-like ATPase/His Kinase A (phospho-acceptor) domain